jgi:hypothetical protein
MATLTPTLTLNSTDAFSDVVNFSVTDSLTTAAPSQSLTKVAIAVSGGSASTLVAAGSANQYVFIRHTGYQSDGTSATTNQLAIELGGNTDLLRLSAGEWCFFTSKSDQAVEALSSSSQTILVEYAYWTQG